MIKLRPKGTKKQTHSKNNSTDSLGIQRRPRFLSLVSAGTATAVARKPTEPAPIKSVLQLKQLAMGGHRTTRSSSEQFSTTLASTELNRQFSDFC